MSLFRQPRMSDGPLATIGSHSINGVAAPSQLLRTDVLRDFAV